MFETQFIAQGIGQVLGGIVFSVNNKSVLRLLFHDTHEINEPVPVGMAGETGQDLYFGTDLKLLSKNAYSLAGTRKCLHQRLPDGGGTQNSILYCVADISMLFNKVYML